MTFKENLLKKIKIDQLSRQVLSSITPPGSIQKLDLKSMRKLLEMSGYELREERDLDLYYKNHTSEKLKIVVLDNELPLYHTTIDDVVLRKSPTVKEMVRIRKIIKILSDSDVLVSKREVTLMTIQEEAVERLDLRFDESDLAQLSTEGLTAWKTRDAGGILECLILFSELLKWAPLPKKMTIGNQNAVGDRTAAVDGKNIWGPMVLYNSENNAIKWIEAHIKEDDSEGIVRLQQIAAGKKQADGDGAEVFRRLKEAALQTQE